MNRRLTTLASMIALAFIAPSLLISIAHAAPSRAQSTVPSQDLGLAPASDVKELTLVLQLPDRAGLESFVASTVDPTSPNYQKFLTPQQFGARFGQPAAVIARITGYLNSQGIAVTEVFNNNLVLTAQASNAQLSAVFGTSIHNFANSTSNYQAPVSKALVPAALQDVVASVHGLSDKPIYRPHTRVRPDSLTPVDALAAAADPAAAPVAGSPGTYSVADLAVRNNIKPLYSQGITGAGTTLGIMTFAKFKTADVAAYWAWAGLTGNAASASRITTVNVGTGQTNSGADETTLDVEQSGGVAYGANVRVYVAPNTDAGALALYTRAINDNLCDTLSISWGSSELYYDSSTDLPPYDTLFLQAAAQGTPITASSGDEASYDINYPDPTAFPYPNYTTLLSVDFPASSPYVFAAGGTTLPVTLKLSKGTVIVPQERPWAWDYLRSYVVTNSGQAAYYANDFPVGGGGGVSVQYGRPAYQNGLAGVQSSAPGQHMFCVTSPTGTGANTCTPGTDVIDLPAGFAGRNLPDVSLNADPETGYALYYNSRWTTGYGGTSFVAPQLNGIFALLTQKLGHRVGWPHPQFYSLFKTMGYGAGSPFRAITTGTNLYYSAAPNYNPATGLGTLDVSNLANALKPTPPTLTTPVGSAKTGNSLTAAPSPAH